MVRLSDRSVDTQRRGHWRRGALINSSVTGASLSGTVALNTTSSIGGSGNLTLSGVISGSGIGLTKVGAGNLTLSGGSANTYTGVTTVNEGTLLLSKSATSIAGDLVIGDGSGTDTVTLTANNQIADTSAVTINLGGVLGLNAGVTDTIGSLTMTGGSVTTGTGTLTLGGNVTSNASATSATITGNLALGATRTFTIADGAAGDDMSISAIISGAGFGITKEGAGTLTLSGANTYTGKTIINNGTLSIANENRLGANPGAFTADQLTLNGGTLRATATFTMNDANRGITLGSSGGIFDVDPTFTLSVANLIAGSGYLIKNGSGTLSLSGTNSFSGFLSVREGNLSIATINNQGTNGVLGNSAGPVFLGDIGTTGTLQFRAGRVLEHHGVQNDPGRDWGVPG